MKAVRMCLRAIGWCIERLTRRGAIRYLTARPFLIGKVRLFLPEECWTREDRNSIRYRLLRQRWTGLRWRFVEVVEVRKEELLELVEAGLVYQRIPQANPFVVTW